MSKEENKTVEEINEDERVIEPEDIEERAIEIPIERREDEPVLRGGGLRGVADPHMIQTHLDNFLAMLCGETPIDNKVRTSIEYWLKRLADGEGGSTKKIYYHPIYMSDLDTFRCLCAIIDNDPNPYTKTTFTAKVKELMDAGAYINANGAVRNTNTDNFNNIYMMYKYSTSYYVYSHSAVNVNVTFDLDNMMSRVINFNDGVNAIN